MCIHLYLTLPVPEQCEDFAVSSVRSRNPEPPGPESLRRREVACYADSRCVRVCHFSLCSCIPVCFRIPSCCGCVRSLRAPRPLAAGLATPSWLKRKKSGWRAKRHINQVTLKYTESCLRTRITSPSVLLIDRQRCFMKLLNLSYCIPEEEGRGSCCSAVLSSKEKIKMCP